MSRVLVTGGTSTDVAAIGTLAINIRNINEGIFDKLIVFHDGFSKKDMRIINNIFDTTFIRYRYPKKTKNDVVVNYFSPMVFCKYELFGLLSEYDTVVWTDYDVVIKKSLADFCINDGKNIHLLDVGDMRHMFYEDIKTKELCNYDLSGKGMHTSLFLLSNTIQNPKEIRDWCYEMTELCDQDIYLPEQCIFSLALQKFGLTYKDFRFDKYACVPEKSIGDEYILHAAGQPKFWDGRHDEDWENLYKKWIEYGGTQYSARRKKMFNVMKLVYSRLIGVKKHGR